MYSQARTTHGFRLCIKAYMMHSVQGLMYIIKPVFLGPDVYHLCRVGSAAAAVPGLAPGRTGKGATVRESGNGNDPEAAREWTRRHLEAIPKFRRVPGLHGRCPP